MVDDKPQLLLAMKRVLGAKLTTVFVRQGNYAAGSNDKAIDPPPDVAIGAIADLLDLERSHYFAALDREGISHAGQATSKEQA